MQEVDIATGKVLFEWHSLDHVDIKDSWSPILSPFDYFHVNSIDVDLDGNLLVSARNTWGVYKLDRKTGAVIWRLGSKSTDFELGPGVQFMYQHDARAHPDGTITLYDDGAGSASHQSRAIRLGLSMADRRAVLLQEFLHPTPLTAFAMGNAQFLSNGNVVVGWGTAPFVTEFGPLGDVRFDATFDGGAWNYRAFRNTWNARPGSAAIDRGQAPRHRRDGLRELQRQHRDRVLERRRRGGPQRAQTADDREAKRVRDGDQPAQRTGSHRREGTRCPPAPDRGLACRLRRAAPSGWPTAARSRSR